MQALGMVDTDEDGNELSEVVNYSSKDWNNKKEHGFCYHTDDENSDDEDDNVSKVRATTVVMADELTDHFEINFGEEVVTAPVLYGGFKGSSIVGVLSYRVW